MFILVTACEQKQVDVHVPFLRLSLPFFLSSISTAAFLASFLPMQRLRLS